MTVRKFLKLAYNSCSLSELPEKILNKQAMKMRVDEAAIVAEALDVDLQDFVVEVINRCA